MADIMVIQRQLDSAHKTCAALVEQNLKLRQALGFYADLANWQGTDTVLGVMPPNAYDYGEHARNALQEVNS